MNQRSKAENLGKAAVTREFVGSPAKEMEPTTLHFRDELQPPLPLQNEPIDVIAVSAVAANIPKSYPPRPPGRTHPAPIHKHVNGKCFAVKVYTISRDSDSSVSTDDDATEDADNLSVAQDPGGLSAPPAIFRVVDRHDNSSIHGIDVDDPYGTGVKSTRSSQILASLVVNNSADETELAVIRNHPRISRRDLMQTGKSALLLSSTKNIDSGSGHKGDPAQKHLGKIVTVSSSFGSIPGQKDEEGSLTSGSRGPNDIDEEGHECENSETSHQEGGVHSDTIHVGKIQQPSESKRKSPQWLLVIFLAILAGVAVGLGAGLSTVRRTGSVATPVTAAGLIPTFAPTTASANTFTMNSTSNNNLQPTNISSNLTHLRSDPVVPKTLAPNTFSPSGFAGPAVVWDALPRTQYGSQLGARLGKLVAISGEGAVVAAVQNLALNDTLQLYNVSSSGSFHLLESAEFESIQDIAVNHDGSVVAVGLAQGMVHVMRLVGNGTSRMHFSFLGMGIAAPADTRGSNGTGTTTMIDLSVSLSADGNRIGIASVHNGYSLFQVLDLIVSNGTGAWERVGNSLLIPGLHDFATADLSGNGLILATSRSYLNGNNRVGNLKVFELQSSGWKSIGQNLSFSQAFAPVSLSYDGLTMATTDSALSSNVYYYNSTIDLWQRLGSQLPTGSEISLAGSGRRLALSNSDRNLVSVWELDASLTVWDNTARFNVMDPQMAMSAGGDRLVLGAPSYTGTWWQEGELSIVEAQPVSGR